MKIYDVHVYSNAEEQKKVMNDACEFIGKIIRKHSNARFTCAVSEGIRALVASDSPLKKEYANQILYNRLHSPQITIKSERPSGLRRWFKGFAFN